LIYVAGRRFTERTIAEGGAVKPYPLCKDAPFYGQPVFAQCSAFLWAPDVMATAGHCIDADSCSYLDFVFDAGFYAVGGNPQFVQRSAVAHCKEIIFRQQKDGLDFALVRLTAPVLDRPPLEHRASGRVPDDATLAMMGFPDGIPLKITLDGRVQDNSPATSFLTTLDAFHGNSGSPVLNLATLEVEGILVAGETDWQLRNGCLVPVVCKDHCRFETVTRATAVSEGPDLAKASLVPGRVTVEGIEMQGASTTDSPLQPGTSGPARITVAYPEAIKFKDGARLRVSSASRGVRVEANVGVDAWFSRAMARVDLSIDRDLRCGDRLFLDLELGDGTRKIMGRDAVTLCLPFRGANDLVYREADHPHWGMPSPVRQSVKDDAASIFTTNEPFYCESSAKCECYYTVRADQATTLDNLVGWSLKDYTTPIAYVGKEGQTFVCDKLSAGTAASTKYAFFVRRVGARTPVQRLRYFDVSKVTDL
jgi:hypothetical protein